MSTIAKQQQESHYWLYNKQFFKDMSADYFRPQYWQTQQAVTGQETGRGTTWFFHYKNHHLVLKHYLRGGLISRLSKDKYLFKNWRACRPISEFELLHELHRRHLAVPRPIAAQVIRQGLCYRADLITERIPDARDLLQVLRHTQDSEFYRELGKFIAEFHRHGVYHADLNIQNILQDGSGKFWLIDFDRAKLLPPNKTWQVRTLERLLRSFNKELQRHQIKWQNSDWNILADSYAQAIKQK